MDVTLTGRGVPIQVVRTYNSRGQSPENYYFGELWTYNFAAKIDFADENIVTYSNTTGGKYIFIKDGSDYNSPPGVNLIFGKDFVSGQYVLENADGAKTFFNNDGNVDKYKDTNGNTTTISYDDYNRPVRITDASNRYITLTYQNNKLIQITGNEIPTVDYSYDIFGKYLEKVTKKTSTGAVIYTINYDYNPNNKLKTITDGENNTTTVKYDDNNQVVEIQKSLTQANLQDSNITTKYNYNRPITDITDSKSFVKRYICNSSGNPEEIIDDYNATNAGLNLKTSYEWNTDLVLTQLQDAFENKYNYTYTDIAVAKNSKYDIARITYPDETFESYEYINANQNPENYKSELKQHNNQLGQGSYYLYDANRNLTSASNTTTNTQISQYNTYGDIVNQTKRMGIANNLIKNSSFEDISGSFPRQWRIGVRSNGQVPSGSVLLDGTTSVNGRYSMKLISAGKTEAEIPKLQTNYLFPVTPNTKYILSWYVKTEGVDKSGGGATANIQWCDKNAVPIVTSTNIGKATGTNDWTRKAASANSPGGAVLARLEFVVNDKGTAWFDNVQLEDGTTINEYNMLGNPGFEMSDDGKRPSLWTWEGFSEEEKIINTDDRHLGVNSAYIRGKLNTNKTLSYTLKDLNGRAGDTIYFSGFSSHESGSDVVDASFFTE